MVNPIIYAEVSVGYARIEDVERALDLPDFYVGAHAAVCGHRLPTRDARRYRTYFPRLDVIAPPGGSSPR